MGTPITSPNQFTQPGQQNTGGDKRPEVHKVTDWNQEPEGPTSRLDPTDDPWATSPPPPMGSYRLKLFVGRDGVTRGLVREGNPQNPEDYYYSCDLECRIVSDDKESNGFPVFDRINTMIGRGKNLSTMAGLLVKMGISLPPQATAKQVAMAFSNSIKAEPVLWANLDWEARVQDGLRRNGSENWITPLATMTDFPANGKGGFLHESSVQLSRGGKARVRARLVVVDWGTAQGVRPLSAIPTTAGTVGAFGGVPSAPVIPAFAPAPVAAPAATSSGFGTMQPIAPVTAAPTPPWPNQPATNAAPAPPAQQGDFSSLLRS